MNQVEKLSFKAPSVNKGELKTYNFNGDGLNALLFFPGAFSSVCTEEMCRIRDTTAKRYGTDVDIIGISIDTTSTLEEFQEEYNLGFTFISDYNKSIIEQYNVKTSFQELGIKGVAKRSIFLIDDREIIYSEVVEDPREMPNLEKLNSKIEEKIEKQQ